MTVSDALLQVSKRSRQFVEMLEGRERSLAEERELLEKSEVSLKAAERGSKILIDLAEVVQNKTHQHIASIVTRCLHAVFDESYEFRIVIEQKRNRAEAQLMLMHHGELVDPLEAESGGVVDVAAFGLRLAAMLLHQPKLRRLLVLDEPFRFLAKKNLPKLAILVESLASEMGVQIIMVTHERELQLGDVIEL